MKKILTIISIFTVFCLMSCNKQADDESNKKYIFFRTVTNESNYYSSAYAKEGNDYYCINIKDNEMKMGKYCYIESLPSKYIVGIDSEYEGIVNEIGMEEFVEYLPVPRVNKLLVSLYDIETQELKENIDVKKILDDSGKYICLKKLQSYRMLLIDKEPYITLYISDNLYLPKEVEKPEKNEEYTGINERTIYVNLSTKQIFEEKDIFNEEQIRENDRMDIFGVDYYGGSTEFKAYVSSKEHWDGVVEASINVQNLNENYKKLYEKFPDLKSKVDKLKRQKKDAELTVILTENPTYEDIAELFMEEGQKLSFNDVVIKSEDSIDGLEHKIHSFDEWEKYYRIDETDTAIVSEIIPR